jgi:hypothetical protein
MRRATDSRREALTIAIVIHRGLNRTILGSRMLLGIETARIIRFEFEDLDKIPRPIIMIRQ